MSSEELGGRCSIFASVSILLSARRGEKKGIYVWEAEVTTAEAAEPWHHEPPRWNEAELGSDPDYAAYQLGFPRSFLFCGMQSIMAFIP